MKALLILAVAAGGAWAAAAFSDAQLAAQFPADLGADKIDVSSYPKAQQENYKLFEKTCSQCHTLARPINSSLVTRPDWKRFVDRMHLRTKVRPGIVINDKDIPKILDFLAYDSQHRKTGKNKAAFDAESARLKALFADAKAEKAKRQAATDEQKVKTMPVDNGASNPQRAQ